MKNKFNIYTLFILFAGSLWGTSGIFVRTLKEYNLSEMSLVIIRAFFSLLILALIILFSDYHLFRIRIKDLWLFAASGIISVVMFNYCYYKTMSLTSLSVAAVLLYTAPFFVVIMSVFIFKQKLTVKKCLACVSAFLGCCLVTGAFSSSAPISKAALFFGIMTGFGYSLYTIFGRLLLERGYSSLTIIFYTFLFATLGSIPFTNVKTVVNTMTQYPYALLIGIAMALINTVIPYIIYTVALSNVDASVAPVIATVEPVVATLIGSVFYNEKLTLSGVTGIILVLLSVVILNLKAGGQNEPSENKSKRKDKSCSIS